jgi:hypothetical protein
MAILQNTTVSGSLVVTGDLTARQFILSSSVTFFTESFASGSTRFGDSVDDVMRITGSLMISSSFGVSLFVTSSTGQVGIGNSSPQSQLVVGKSGNNATLEFNMNNTGYSRIFSYDRTAVSPTNLILQDPGGSVGIGITNPGSGLEVATNGASLNAIRSTTTQAYNAGPETSIVFRYKHNTAGDYTSGALINTAKDNATDGNQSGNLQFWTNNAGTVAEKMRITSAGNVGIGTNSPSALLHLGVADAAVDGTKGVKITNPAGTTVMLECGVSSDSFVGTTSASDFSIRTANSERIKITSAGNVGIAVNPSSGIRLQVRAETSDSSSQAMNIGKANGTDLIYVRADGYLYSVGAWSGSDIRLKENITDLDNGLQKVLGLKAKKFDLIDGLKNNFGFIAQEMQEVIPDAVSVFEEKEQLLAVRMDFIIPHLVKAIQELKAENDSLKEILTRNNIA